MKTLIKTIVLFVVTISINFNGQVLITTKPQTNYTPDASSILHILDSKRGILLPRVALTSASDITTIPTPVEGLLAYNTTTGKFNYFSNNTWNKNFEVADAQAIVKVTTNSVATSSSPTSITGNFVDGNFLIDSGPTGWTDLNVNLTLNPTNATNTILINSEGMAHFDNTSQINRYAFAIGLFVDGQLKIVRKFRADENGACQWKKFELTGLFYNITSNTNHSVKLYARNLTRTSTTQGNIITYGGGATGCDNLNSDMAKIFISAQITQ